MTQNHLPREKSVLSPGAFLVRGLLVGLVAGLLGFAVAFLVGEPHVERAIELEEAAAAHAHGADKPADEATDEHTTEIARGTQRTAGLLTGTLAIGVALGGIVALAAAYAVGRLGTLTARQATLTVSLTGFVAVALVPFLKYPPNPPAVGSGDTIGSRTTSYFGLQSLSVLAAVAAVFLALRLWRRIGGVEASAAAGATYVVLMVVATVLLPTSDEVGGFPASTLWSFRIASLLTLATMWTVIGVGLTWLVGRLHDRARADAERRALAASL